MKQDYWLRLLVCVGLLWGASACSSIDFSGSTWQPLPVPQLIGIANADEVVLNWGWWLDGQEDVEAQADWELLIFIGDQDPDKLELLKAVPVKPYTARLDDLQTGNLYYVSIALTNSQGDTTHSNIIGVARTKQPTLEAVHADQATSSQNGTWINTYELIYERRDPVDSALRLYQYDIRTQTETYLVPGADPDWNYAQEKLAYRTLKDPSIGLNATAINTFSPNVGGGVDGAFGGERFYAQPSWSDAGDAIVCLMLNDQLNQYEMVQYSPQQGGLPSPVASTVLGFEGGGTAEIRSPQHPVWWPGQDRVVFDLVEQKTTVDFTYSARDIYAIVPGTFEIDPVIYSPWNDFNSAFSPDGTQVAFLSDRAGYLGIWIYHVVDDRWEQWNSLDEVPTISGEHKLEWSPRANELLFTRLDENQSPSLFRYVRNQ